MRSFHVGHALPNTLRHCSNACTVLSPNPCRNCWSKLKRSMPSNFRKPCKPKNHELFMSIWWYLMNIHEPTESTRSHCCVWGKGRKTSDSPGAPAWRRPPHKSLQIHWDYFTGVGHVSGMLPYAVLHTILPIDPEIFWTSKCLILFDAFLKQLKTSLCLHLCGTLGAQTHIGCLLHMP